MSPAAQHSTESLPSDNTGCPTEKQAQPSQPEHEREQRNTGIFVYPSPKLPTLSSVSEQTQETSQSAAEGLSNFSDLIPYASAESGKGKGSCPVVPSYPNLVASFHMTSPDQCLPDPSREQSTSNHHTHPFLAQGQEALSTNQLPSQGQYSSTSSDNIERLND